MRGFQGAWKNAVSDIMYETCWSAMEALAEGLPAFGERMAALAADLATPEFEMPSLSRKPEEQRKPAKEGVARKVQAEHVFTQNAVRLGVGAATGGPRPIKVRHHVDDEGRLFAYAERSCGLHSCCCENEDCSKTSS